MEIRGGGIRREAGVDTKSRLHRGVTYEYSPCLWQRTLQEKVKVDKHAQ